VFTIVFTILGIGFLNLIYKYGAKAMLSRFFAIILTLIVATACSTTDSNKGSSDSTDVTSDKYRVASSDLDTFTKIPGSSVDARANDRVFFAFDSAVLNSTSQKTLDKQVAWLKKNSNKNVIVEGHADERGTREYNIALGDRRANAVKKYLVNSGVSASRITTISYGKERPAVLGSNSAAWAENRRSVTVPK